MIKKITPSISKQKRCLSSKKTMEMEGIKNIKKDVEDYGKTPRTDKRKNTHKKAKPKKHK